MNTDIDILLAKYFSGEASVEDLSRLDDWLAQSQANEEYFDQMTQLYEKTAFIEPSQNPNITKAWNIFEQHIANEEREKGQEEVSPKKIRRSIKPLYLQIAAAFAVLISVSLFFLFRQGDDTIQVVATNTVINHTMPDNSKVQLAENSTITYDADYGKGERAISLKGKATFEIEGEGDGKMLVHADEVIIEDIGTVFTVDAQPDKSHITVSVKSGKVLFYTLIDEGLALEAGEAGTFNKKTKAFEKLVSNDIITGSKRNPIIFNATPLPEAINILNQNFGTTIVISDSKLNSKLITVNFDPDEDIGQILQIIAETLELNIKYQNGIYTLY